ncbi:MAG: methionyl-tRNA formyltransferase [Candidatus Gracilibacteria bacterium]|jgi:methionyl-tRNA formyltransferase
MKIVFFGTPQFAVASLEALSLTPGVEILAVVTQKDKPIGRKQKITQTPVKQKAIQLEVKVLDSDIVKKLENVKADFFVVIAYGEILPNTLLNKPKYGCINVHASLLPKYRGASPIQECLLNGDKETGVTIMKIDSKMDHGAVYLLKKLAIDKSDNIETLTKKLSELSAKILPFTLKDIEEGRLSTIQQNELKASYCRKVKKEDGKIDFKKQTATEIVNMIKAYTPWPSAFANFKDKKIKILAAESSDTQLPAGTMVVDGKILKIGTKKGCLLPLKLQPEGKNPMDISAFLNGYKTFFTETVPAKATNK